MENSKRYDHNCELCEFLGQYKKYDLYFHKEESCDLNSLVAIYHINHQNLMEDLVSNIYQGDNKILTEAFNRAIEKNLIEIPLLDLTKEVITKIMDKENSFEQSFLSLIKHCYTEKVWNNIEKLDGFCKCSRTTNEFIIEELKRRFPDSAQQIMLLWLNMGFSTVESMDDWKIQLAPFKRMEDQEIQLASFKKME